MTFLTQYGILIIITSVVFRVTRDEPAVSCGGY